MLTGGGVGGGVGGGSGGGEGGGGEGGGKGGGDGGGGNGGGEGGGEGGGGEGGGEGGGFGGGLGGGLRGDGAKAGERRTRKERRLDKEWNTSRISCPLAKVRWKSGCSKSLKCVCMRTPPSARRPKVHAKRKTSSFVRPFSKAQILGAFTTLSLVAACYPLAVGGERGCE